MNFLRAISNLLRFDRTNWKALALCLFAAAVFWMFNALNKSYATNLRLPLKFEFDNSKFIAVEPLPSHLVLNVNGNGWEIFRKSLGVKVPSISLPLERPAETHKIATTSLTPIVASQIGTLQVNYIVTDTLRLKIEHKTTRRINLRVHLNDFSFKPGFGRTSPVVILPDTVLLEGPKSIVEDLPDTISLKIDAVGISSNFRENIEITIQDNEFISRNPPVTEVMFEVGPVEEIKLRVRLNLPKLPRGVEVQSDSADCVFIVAQKERNRFLSEVSTLSASLTVPQLAKGENKSLLPFLQGLPTFAQLVHIDSVKVKKY